MPGAYDLLDAVSGPGLATGTEAFVGVPCFAGATRATATLKYFVPTLAYRIPVYNLPSGSTTLTTTLMAAGLLRSTSPASTAILIPTLATLGITYDSSADIAFPVQRKGTGPLAVNAGVGVTLDVVTNDIDPISMPQNHEWVWVVLDAADSWHFE